MTADRLHAPVRRRFGPFGAPATGGASAALGAVALLVAGTGVLLVGAFEAGWPLVPLALALFLPTAAIVALHLAEHPHTRFGPANVVTALRGGMAAVVGALLWEAERFGAPGGEALLWALVGVALVALALDGVDGLLARRTGLASRFGERFDMETDAFLILVLCALALAAGKAGAFVLLIGLMRYGFVAWATVEPRLRAPLAPSFRRKAVCVLQIAILCIVLLPIVPPAVSNALAALALAALAASFAVDVRALLRARPA